MKRCTLCGGKLNSEKRCTLCGLDNTKNDDMYKKMINRNSCENEPLTHVHEEPVPRKVEKRPQIVKPSINMSQQKTNTYNKPQYNGNSMQKKRTVSTASVPKNAKKAVGCSTFIGLIPIIIAFIGIMSNIFEDVFSDFSEAIPEPDYYIEEEVEFDPYEWVVDEMPGEGEIFSTTLKAGIYEIGYHLPMGIYQLDLESDYGTVEVRDEHNSIYLSEFLDSYADNTKMEDVCLFDGAYLVVYTGTEVFVQTENAQPLSVDGTVNEQQEAVKIEEKLVVGEELQPGSYDIRYKTVEDEFSFVDVVITPKDMDYGFHMTFGSEMVEEVFHNVPLPEGAVITVDSDYFENVEYLELVPSMATSDTDLNSFYYAY